MCSACGEVLKTEIEGHNWNGGTQCKDCLAPRNANTEKTLAGDCGENNHSFSYYTATRIINMKVNVIDAPDIYHYNYKMCTKCGKTEDVTKEKHSNWKYEDGQYICGICGYTTPDKPEGYTGNKDQGDKDQGDKDQGDKDQGDKDQGDKDQGDKDQGDKDQGDKDQGDKDQGDKDQGDKDQGDKDQGDKDQGDKDQGDKDQGDKDQGDKDQGDKDIPCTHEGYVIIRHDDTYTDKSDTMHKVSGYCLNCDKEVSGTYPHVYVNGKCECGQELPLETISKNNLFSVEFVAPTASKLAGGEEIKLIVSAKEIEYLSSWDKELKTGAPTTASKEISAGKIPDQDGNWYFYIYSLTDTEGNKTVVNLEYTFVVDKNAANLDDFEENGEESKEELENKNEMCANCKKETLFSTTNDGKKYCTVCGLATDGTNIEVSAGGSTSVVYKVCKECEKVTLFDNKEDAKACPECKTEYLVDEDKEESGSFEAEMPIM